MNIDSQEIEQLIDASIRHEHFDRTAIAVVEALVISAIGLYFVASVISLFFA
jgi:hypothetical protein